MPRERSPSQSQRENRKESQWEHVELLVSANTDADTGWVDVEAERVEPATEPIDRYLGKATDTVGRGSLNLR